MSPDLAVKVQLLLRAPAFLEDLEKTAAVLGLNNNQKAEAVLRAAGAMDLGNIEKQAVNLQGVGQLAEMAAPVAKKAIPWGWIASALGAGAAGDYFANPLNYSAVNSARNAGITEGMTHAPKFDNYTGLGVGGLGGGVLGAMLGSGVSDGDTVGTGIGASLGAAGGAGIGSYIQEMMRNKATA